MRSPLVKARAPASRVAVAACSSVKTRTPLKSRPKLDSIDWRTVRGSDCPPLRSSAVVTLGGRAAGAAVVEARWTALLQWGQVPHAHGALTGSDAFDD